MEIWDGNLQCFSSGIDLQRKYLTGTFHILTLAEEFKSLFYLNDLSLVFQNRLPLCLIIKPSPHAINKIPNLVQQQQKNQFQKLVEKCNPSERRKYYFTCNTLWQFLTWKMTFY